MPTFGLMLMCFRRFAGPRRQAEEDFVLLVTLPVGTMADVILPLEGAKETRLVGAGGPQELRATGTRLQ